MAKIRDLYKILTPTLQKIIGNTGWLFADKVFRMGVGVFVWVWVARYLGPDDFGIFNYAIAFVALLTPISTLGLDNLVIREVVKNKNARYEILGSAFAMRFVGGLLTFLLAFGLISIVRPGQTVIVWIVVIIGAGTIFQSFDIIDLWFQSEVKSKFTVIAKNIAFTISAVVKVVLIQIQAPLISFAGISLCEIIIGSIGLLYFYLKENNKLSMWKISKLRIRELLRESIPLLISNSAILLYMKVDILILGQMKNETAVGYYSAATKISEAFYFVAVIIASSVFPVIIENEELYFKRLKKLLDVTSALGYAIVIPLFLLSNTIILIFGKQYLTSGPILAAHIWATMFVFLGMAQGSWYIKEGRSGIYLQMRRTIIGLIINVVLNIILIPSMSGLGAAVATIIAYSYVGYFSNIFNKKTRKIFIMQTKSLLLYGLFKRKEDAA
jgi:PST family polysaccharide transporter